LLTKAYAERSTFHDPSFAPTGQNRAGEQHGQLDNAGDPPQKSDGKRERSPYNFPN
jgi:hypothetical protein